MSKYHSKKITVGDETFDSKKEFRRYQELRLMEKAGLILELRRQVPFVLIPAIREPASTGPRGSVKPGKVIEKQVVYIADFVYCKGSELVVEDAKGVRTAEYIIKRKLMLHINGIRILET